MHEHGDGEVPALTPSSLAQERVLRLRHVRLQTCRRPTNNSIYTLPEMPVVEDKEREWSRQSITRSRRLTERSDGRLEAELLVGRESRRILHTAARGTRVVSTHRAH